MPVVKNTPGKKNLGKLSKKKKKKIYTKIAAMEAAKKSASQPSVQKGRAGTSR